MFDVMGADLEMFLGAIIINKFNLVQKCIIIYNF